MVATMSLMLTGAPDAKSTVNRAPFAFELFDDFFQALAVNAGGDEKTKIKEDGAHSLSMK